MGSNLVIVAIPARDEKVWKVSSEKVPHLTLLFLGENTGDVAKLEQIVEFVDHAVTVEQHGPVMLDVDERGTLGPDEADVLFFNKDYSIKWLTHFRNQLLQQNDIRAAYESVQQYPEWQPHLTLGYPATPANEDEIPDHGLNWITFDRIAVWTEDFDGPEFKLRWSEREMEPCMAMASTNDARKALGLDALVRELEPLEHHGVKGMRWGVRKDIGPNGAHILVNEKTGRASVSKGVAAGLVGSVLIMPPVTLAMFLSPRVRSEFKAADTHNKNLAKDAKWHKELNSAKSAVKVHNKAADEINTKISAFNNDKRWKNKDGTDIDLGTNPAKQAEYDKAVERELINPAFSRASLAVHGSKSPGGRYEFSIEDHSTATFKVKDTHAQHAADDVVTVTYKIVRDDLGYITGFQIEDSMAQTADRGAEFIEHHGIKGMHWGIRNRQSKRSTPMPVAPKATSKVPSGNARKTKVEVTGGHNHPAHPDAIKVAEAKAKLKKSGTASLSNQELRDVANRVQLENQVKLLTGRKGRQFVTRQLQNEGQNLARAGVRTGVKKGVAKVGIAALA